MSTSQHAATGECLIAGHPLSQWLRNWTMPLHILEASRIRSNLRDFSRVFRDLYRHGEIRYAVKAAAHPEVLKIAREEGAGADVTSPFEMEAALDAAIPPPMLDVNGNCKEDELIDKAVGLDMLIIADSIEEFLHLSSRAQALGKTPRVMLRVSGFSIEKVTSDAVFTAGRWSKFGAALDTIPSFMDMLDQHGHIRFLGFHTHIGSQIASAAPYLTVMGIMVELSLMLKEKRGACGMLNMGGGYPVSYLDEKSWEELKHHVRQGYERSLQHDFSQVFCWRNERGGFETEKDGTLGAWSGEAFFSPFPGASMVRAILEGEINVHGKRMPVKEALSMLGEPVFCIEPGRSIVENAGLTLARVSHVRTVAGGHNLVTVEMGVMNHCDAMLENIPNRWEIAGEVPGAEPFVTFIGGNLCFSGDMLARFKQKLQRRPVRGDILIIHDTGAYTSHFMASNANSFARPARLLVHDDGTVKVLHKKDTYGDIFSLH